MLRQLFLKIYLYLHVLLGTDMSELDKLLHSNPITVHTSGIEYAGPTSCRRIQVAEGEGEYSTDDPARCT